VFRYEQIQPLFGKREISRGAQTETKTGGEENSHK
jgi:hypothetical protein